MKTKTILGICLSLCAWSFTGCSDDDNADLFPEGTSSLRMMNEDNGKTLLGNSDVYITNGGNFKSNEYPLFDMGEKRGIADIGMPNFANMAPEVAVYPRHGYVICNNGDVRTFPSGEQAIRQDANVYRVYVDSWIKDKDGNNTGANVHFLLGKPDDSGQIPAWHSDIEWNFVPVKENPLVLTLPSDDIEVERLYELENYDRLDYTVQGRTITFKIINYTGTYETFQVRIRCGHIYTEAIISLKNTY